MTILGDNLMVSRMRLSTKAIQVTQTLPRHLPTVITFTSHCLFGDDKEHVKINKMLGTNAMTQLNL